MFSSRMCMIAGLGLSLLLWAGSGVSAAAELPASSWPQFGRDAQRTGDNPGARLAFPLERTTAVQFPAPIYASPAVVDGNVYIQDALGNVACIDSGSNKVLWTTRIGGINNTSSPAVADGKVYIGSSADALFILDARTGKVLHQVPAEGGVLTAPALANGAVYFGTFNGELVKIDPNGKVLWSFSGGRISNNDFALLDRDIIFFAGSSNTILYRLHDEGDQVRVVSKSSAPSNCCPMGGPVFIGPDSYAFQSFDSEFGRFYWKADGKSVVAGDISDSRIVPAARDGLVYRGDKCFALEGTTLKQLWRTEPNELYDGGFHSSPALAKEVLVVGCERGLVHAFALEGNEKVRKPVWQFKTVRAGEPNSAVSSSPAVVDGKIFFGGEDGILYGLGQGSEVAIVDLPVRDLDRRRTVLKGSEWPTPGGDAGYSFISPDREVRPPFDIAWKAQIWSVFKAPMVVAEGKVFCGGRLGNLTALDAATGEILWKFHHPGVESRPGPTYADGKLLIMRTRNAQGDSPYIRGASGGPSGEGLWCHDAATGKVLWHRPMKFKYHFNHDGLAIDAGRVFVAELVSPTELHLAAFAIDNGHEIWRRPLTDVLPGTKKSYKLPPRFSGVMAGGLWCVSLSDQATLALDPSTGKTVWSNEDLFITVRSRIGARDGVLVIFAGDGDYAVDAKTGKRLWKGAAKSSRYSQALTDRYLQSKGQEGVYPPAVCAWPIYANGHWYSHHSYASTHGSNRLGCMAEPENGEVSFLNPKMVVWTFDFLSNACPSPSPAYGRMYYSPASEGVIYSFVPK